MNEKIGLHPRNKHKSSYDFAELIKSHPPLSSFVVKNKFNNESINFSDAAAVKALNTALLKHFYKISYWDVPKDYLCPPIPGRADYIHQVADLLTPVNGQVPTGPSINMLDIGVGANCVYPLIANSEYGWSVVGSDIDVTAIDNATKIIKENSLESFIKIRHQDDKNKFFENIIKKDEFFHIVVCNPPFNTSAEESAQVSERKNRNLGIKKGNQNFGGQSTELWYEGGEAAFILKMIQESVAYQKNCLWFSSLVSRSVTLPLVYEELKKRNVANFKTIDLNQGQKKSRIVAWTFSR
jgi:23S rRNA (adenine1618-N6)-methyltransferase